ncbi:MAG: cytochrome c family protein [Deltaproteobacteria bacterium]|nr:cytochrome c family protein [Deltaproteobacteria bacterium]MBW2053543.1 cytochrome c family protein [Deltaproteobacteria bacterium]MBW2142097.1 cytochrome c family protein [Deltaproteobacteria bacterium]
MPKTQTIKRLTCVLAGIMVFGIFLLLWPEISLAEEPLYVGAIKCKGCHKKEYAAWMKEKHSKAMSALNAEEQKNPKCLECHTTGYGKAAKPTAKLENVQCESCHGPASLYKTTKIMSKKKYKKDPKKAHQMAVAAGLIEPDEKACIQCHNDRAPTFKGFDFKATIEKVNHKD